MQFFVLFFWVLPKLSHLYPFYTKAGIPIAHGYEAVPQSDFH